MEKELEELRQREIEQREREKQQLASRNEEEEDIDEFVGSMDFSMHSFNNLRQSITLSTRPPDPQ